MLTPTLKRIVAALCLGALLLAIASLQSGLEGEICKNANDLRPSDCASHYIFIVFGWNILWWISHNLLELGTIALAGFVLIQVRDSRKSSERQLRAYVDVVSGQILNFGKPGNVKLRLIIKNSGQTPAYHLSHWTSVGADELPPKAGFESPNIAVVRSTLAPGAFTTVIQEYGPLSANQIAKIKAKKAAIWAWGRIDYVDTFGHRRKSWFRLIYEGGTTSPPGGMSLDENGNGTD
jgi:hypothetical protein